MVDRGLYMCSVVLQEWVMVSGMAQAIRKGSGLVYRPTHYPGSRMPPLIVSLRSICTHTGL